ncbi:MAG: molybdopterin-dependent oxidoreductase [Pseudomonadales bacterium]|nr:molybdopterin-dependent oxidoreductase [Pseudomonadales bacterium]
MSDPIATQPAVSSAGGTLVSSRRQFLKWGGAGAGGLVMSIQFSGCSSMADSEQSRSEGSANNPEAPFKANAWVEIHPDERIYLILDRVEMGQGTYTGMATLLAEELEVSPDRIKLKTAPVGAAYIHPEYGMQITGGSSSLRTNWLRLREAGAHARALFAQAAAEVWQVDSKDVFVRDGVCENRVTGSRLSYGALAPLAATQRLEISPQLKSAKQFRYIGKKSTRLDAQLKSFGKALYGIDVEQPDMLYAVVIRAPSLGGTVLSFSAEAAMQQPGVVNIGQVPSGVAVIARSYWQARSAAGQVKVNWQSGKLATLSTEGIYDLYRQAAGKDSGTSVRSVGDYEDALEVADSTLSVEYQAPLLAHATMEPMNCTAQVGSDFCRIWAPTQGPDIARAVAVRETGLSHDQVSVHTTLLGGGFGRRLNQDFVAEAVNVAKLVDKPVKVIWSREDDTRNDFYRPATYHRLSAAFNAEGQATGWQHQIVGPRIMDHYAVDAVGVLAPTWTPQSVVNVLSKVAPGLAPDESPVEGAKELPYALDNIDVRYTHADPGVPITFWRSVGHSQNAFVVESFIDELAHHARQDPFDYRDKLLQQDARAQGVLRAVAKAARWGKPFVSGAVQGIACHKSFSTYAAQVVELSVSDQQIKVHRVTCAVDCGLVVNPDIVISQIESGIVFGLTAALFGDITIKEGVIQQSNFHDYPLLRMQDTPEIEVVIVPSAESPTGIGEPGVPPVAPAVANAVYVATGERLRSLPLKLPATSG